MDSKDSKYKLSYGVYIENYIEVNPIDIRHHHSYNVNYKVQSSKIYVLQHGCSIFC